MKESLRNKLEAYCKKNEWGITDKDIAETLIECGDNKKVYGHDEHRWYTTYKQVKKIDDFYVEFQTYTSSGDEPALDRADWDKMVLESVIEVEPIEVKAIDYREIK